MPCPHWLGVPASAVGIGMSNVKCKSIWLLDGLGGLGSVPSIQSTDWFRTLSTSCRPAVIVTVGFAGGVSPPPAAGFELASAPTKFSHFTKRPGFVTGTVTGTVLLTFPVKFTPFGLGFVLLTFAFGSH